MIFIGVIYQAAAPEQQFSTHITQRSVSLGKCRALFGDLTVQKGFDGAFLYHDFFGDFKTEIYFASGVSAERFYFNDFPDAGRHEYVLSFMKLRSGSPHPEWKVYLDQSNSISAAKGKKGRLGTLASILAHKGLEVHQPISQDVKAKLSEIVEFARYDHVVSSWMSAYYNKAGLLVSEEIIPFDPQKKWPDIFPITAAEKSSMKEAEQK